MTSIERMVPVLSAEDKFDIKRYSAILFMSEADKNAYLHSVWKTNLNEHTIFGSILDWFLFGANSSLLEVLDKSGIEAVERYLTPKVQDCILEKYPEKIEVVV